MNSYRPNFNIPNFNIPNLNIPNLSIPNLNIPNLSIPNFNIPNLNIPNLNIPNHTTWPLVGVWLKSLCLFACEGDLLSGSDVWPHVLSGGAELRDQTRLKPDRPGTNHLQHPREAHYNV